ncbi:MAG: TetR/AcrR family transcriptional regulator, partial [Proteobacteria bacterium]|nr:TetR/AcrR family transcriptional regulator [Pseudomonadota bacterium]
DLHPVRLTGNLIVVMVLKMGDRSMLIDTHKTSANYHHGNVKEALLIAAQSHIENNEGEMISLRALSKEVGVTPSAVYNHFADKSALILAIKIRIFQSFNRFFAASCKESESPDKALLEMCLAYFHFSREFPSQFRFIFSSSIPVEWSTQEVVDVSCRCIVRVRSLVFAIHKKYKLHCSEEEVVNATLLIWSQLHGIVTLRNSGLICAAVIHQKWPEKCGLTDNAQVEKLIKDHVQIMINGMLNSSRGRTIISSQIKLDAP